MSAEADYKNLLHEDLCKWLSGAQFHQFATNLETYVLESIQYVATQKPKPGDINAYGVSVDTENYSVYCAVSTHRGLWNRLAKAQVQFEDVDALSYRYRIEEWSNESLSASPETNAMLNLKQWSGKLQNARETMIEIFGFDELVKLTDITRRWMIGLSADALLRNKAIFRQLAPADDFVFFTQLTESSAEEMTWALSKTVGIIDALGMIPLGSDV